MVEAIKNKSVRLLTTLLIILLGFGGLYQTYLKAGLPFKLTSVESILIIELVPESEKELTKGDAVTAIDGFKFSSWEEVELYLDGKIFGDYATVNYSV